MKMTNTFLGAIVVASAILAGCASVDVTKTSKGFHSPTDPNAVEILKTVPTVPFEELGTVTVSGFSASEVAMMHNAVRAKAAPLGANAVVLQQEGIVPGTFSSSRWATGVAIYYKK